MKSSQREIFSHFFCLSFPFRANSSLFISSFFFSFWKKCPSNQKYKNPPATCYFFLSFCLIKHKTQKSEWMGPKRDEPLPHSSLTKLSLFIIFIIFMHPSFTSIVGHTHQQANPILHTPQHLIVKSPQSFPMQKAPKLLLLLISNRPIKCLPLPP